MKTDKLVIMLLGPSGCGKSTLERGLTKFNFVKKAVSVTTRPPRESEVSGVDYHFITPDEFTTLQRNQELVQTTEFGGNFYGSATTEYTTDHKIVTLCVVPSSAVVFEKSLDLMFTNIRSLFVYFDISEQRLMQNMIARGDTNEMIQQRLADDDLKAQFDDSGIIPDYIITDDKLNEDTLAKFCLWLAKQPEMAENG